MTQQLFLEGQIDTYFPGLDGYDIRVKKGLVTNDDFVLRSGCMKTYEVMTIKEAADKGFEEAQDMCNWLRGEAEWTDGLYVVNESGEIEREVWVDGSEPEDMILCRDLSDFTAEIRRLASVLYPALEVIENVVDKVENGLMHSKDTYGKCKVVLDLANEVGVR